ncbi:hypothetical protein WK20_11520 [Burkholderia ubonensis]|nr:hypothetical protein WK20_11520 [Burkholderia ubonensis]
MREGDAIRGNAQRSAWHDDMHDADRCARVYLDGGGRRRGGPSIPAARACCARLARQRRVCRHSTASDR